MPSLPACSLRVSAAAPAANTPNEINFSARRARNGVCAGWYESWSYRWDYDRRIFLFARDNGLPMFGVNIPRDQVKTVRMKGFEGLSAEQAAHMPESVNTDSDACLSVPCRILPTALTGCRWTRWRLTRRPSWPEYRPVTYCWR